MNLSFRIDWLLTGDITQDIEPTLFLLLKAIQDQGSLKHSALVTNLSYRHAWGLLKKWENILKHPLVKLERGRGKGARLTEFGEKLIWAEGYLNEQLKPELGRLSVEINDALGHYIRPPTSKTIKMFASHGMAISYLHELLQQDGRFDIDFQFLGSLDSLQNRNSGHCQIAGFHLPLQLVKKIIAPQYKQWISPHRHQLLKVAIREQGIMVKKNNPKNISGLRDLTKRSVHFINRQRGSGTRTILDQLLIQENIDPKNINGYANEEFTHVAVAAMIASGAADAGMGIKAAAEQFNLDFIPFLEEAYVLAIDRDLSQSLKKAIKKTLESKRFRVKINKLAGYNASHSGEEIAFLQLLGDNK